MPRLIGERKSSLRAACQVITRRQNVIGHGCAALVGDTVKQSHDISAADVADLSFTEPWQHVALK
jgi:hypothetical protein